MYNGIFALGFQKSVNKLMPTSILSYKIPQVYSEDNNYKIRVITVAQPQNQWTNISHHSQWNTWGAKKKIIQHATK